MQIGHALRLPGSLTLAPVTLVVLVCASMLTGGVAGALATLAFDQAGSVRQDAGIAPAFDAVQFRAGERAPFALPQPFDPVRFRAEEREPLGQ